MTLKTEAEFLNIPPMFSPRFQTEAMIDHLRKVWSESPQAIKNQLPALLRWKRELSEGIPLIDEYFADAQARIQEMQEREARLKELAETAPERSWNAMRHIHHLEEQP